MSIDTAEVCFAQRLTLGEGPRWCGDSLWWVDIIAGKLFQSQVDTKTGTISTAQEWDILAQVGMVGALAPTNTANMLLATQTGWQLFSPTTGQCRPIADPTPNPDVRFNDGGVDPAGRFVAGTMPLSMPAGAGQLRSLETDGSYRLLLENLTCPNGLAWSADGSELYFIDSPKKAIQVFQYNVATGAIGEELHRINVSDVDGVPDGCCLDGAGILWVGFWGGSCVRGYNVHTGAMIQHIHCPASQITAVAVLPTNELFITSAALENNEAAAGACFRYQRTCTALPAPAWQGNSNS
jgi:sugar lactone lactonase YvrE